MDRLHNFVAALFFTWLAMMIASELHAHHGATHSGTQPAEVRRD